MLNFHYYCGFSNSVTYLIIVEPIDRMFLLYDVTSRDVRKRTVIRRMLQIRERTADLS